MTEVAEQDWKTATLADVADILRGIAFSKDQKRSAPESGLIACLRTSNVQRTVEWDDLWFIPESLVKNPDRFLRVGDILISTANSYELVGKVAPVLQIPTLATFGAFIAAIRPRPEHNARFVYYQLASSQIQQRIRSMASTTTNISNVSTGKLAELPLSIPPRPLQDRIVSEIEKQFTRLDAAIESLKQARARVMSCSAAVLAKATEGTLVATEAEVASREGRPAEDAGSVVASFLGPNGWQADGPPRPPGWCWARLGVIARLQGGITKGQKRKPTDRLRSVPYLRVANVQRGHLDLTVVKEIEATEDEIRLLTLKPGDVLFNEGGDRDKLGRGWVWNDELPECIHQNHVFRARIRVPLDPKFLSWFGNSAGQAYFFAQGKHTTNLASINLTKLSALPVPIPPTSEQRRIVAEVEKQLTLLQNAALAIEVQLGRADRLRASVLRAAFSGQLLTITQVARQ